MLVRFEQFADMDRAILREKQLKRWHRQWKINLIESDNPHWVDLAVGLGLPLVTPRGTRNGSWNKFRMTKWARLLCDDQQPTQTL